MKIGIISSGNDTLTLFQFLTKYNHQYIIYHDQKHFPFEEKSLETIQNYLEKGIHTLIEQGVETMIIDPIYELLLKEKNLYQDHIMPLYQRYLQNEVFPHSLVGKIGILTDFGSRNKAQNLIAEQAETYTLTSAQKNIKSFHFPFCYRVKVASARTYAIANLGVHNPYIIKTLKNDLRYFKDARVDTILPLHYRYFQMQRTIKATLNYHRIRFFDLSFIENTFCELTKT